MARSNLVTVYLTNKELRAIVKELLWKFKGDTDSYAKGFRQGVKAFEWELKKIKEEEG